MPVKIGFQVVSCSGEDDRYRVSELNYHGPTVRGWRSPFNCPFPQEIVLCLDIFAILQQIQILVHQYLIPRKIEIWINENSVEQSPSERLPDRFQYLGFITFSDNKATGFRSRELKSILIPSEKPIKFVKLRIYENHVNNKNIFNQVGIIGINILGDEIDFKLSESECNNNVFHRWSSMYSSNTSNNGNHISPYDDLAFEMYVDEETAKIIKILVQKKQQAVLEEDFEQANILKITLEDLRAAGEILGLYEQEKKQAIQLEDFDRAKLKKLQINDFREKVYSTLNIRALLNQPEGDEYTSQPHPDDINNDNIIESAFHKFEETDYPVKYINNSKSFKKLSTFNQYTVCSQLSHSKSQMGISNQKDNSCSILTKIQPFTSSMSNPQLHQYLQDMQEKTFQTIRPGNEIASVPDNECERTPSRSSLSSESEESAVFNAFPKENLDYASLPLLPSEEIQQEREKKNELLNGFRINGVKTPPEGVVDRSRSKMLESSRIRSKSVTTGTVKSSFEAYEDRMLPALRNYHGNEVVRECQLIFDQQTRTALNERERKQALLPISVFGMELIEKFYSKSFNDKEEGLKLLQQELKKVIDSGEGSSGIICGSHNKMARAAIFLLHRALRDKVYSVYCGAAETIRLFFTEFVPRRVSSSEVAKSVEKLLPELLAKSGDVTPRIHNMAAHTILSMAECDEVRRLNVIPTHLSRPLMSSVHPRLALSRLEMVEQLLLNHGISKDKRSGLTCRTLAEFGSSGLHHPAEAVRKVSERILIHVYKVNPKMVRKQLPPDDNVTRRNLLYRQLFQEFDIMDSQRKSNEQVNDEEYLKLKINERQSTERGPEQKSFSINNNHQLEGGNIQWKNFDSQLKTIKNFMAINLKEKNANRSSPQKSSACKSLPKSNDRIYNEIQINPAPKTTLGFDTGLKLLKRNQTTAISDTKTERRNNSTSKSLTFANDQIEITTNETAVKFPSLTDSIDTNKARLLFDQKKDTKIKKVNYAIPDKRSDLAGSEIKSTKSQLKGRGQKNLNAPSGIPVPTIGFSKRHYNSVKKQSGHTSEEPSLLPTPGKAKTSTPKIKQLGKVIRYPLETQEDKKLGFIKDKKENSPSNTDRNLFDIFSRHASAKNSDKSNRFSESMLASIKENEFLDVPVTNGLDNKRITLKTCIFCLASIKWTTDDSLNTHYLTNCPMLTICEYCTEVIEISGFNNHLLDECTQKHLFQKCCTCQQPLLADLLDNHECTGSPNDPIKTRCPFCHEDIGEDDSCWRNHLMGENVCKNHPRPQ